MSGPESARHGKNGPLTERDVAQRIDAPRQPVYIIRGRSDG